MNLSNVYDARMVSTDGSRLSERTKKQHDEIVWVLAECKGRVGGSEGAAVRMGLSRTTLISRMKKLGINPHDYESFRSHALAQ